jgi:hypothetical protein
MRLLPLTLIAVGLLSGCAGNVADYVGPREGIIAPQLARYGLDATEARCVSTSLVGSLTPLQLRQLTRAASSVQQGYFDPARLTIRDLAHVASTMGDPQIRLELTRAAESCQVGVEAPVAEAAAPDVPAEAAAPVAEWLNLGAAPTGQAIAVDAATLEREPTARKAWFRLTNPNETAATGIAYLLRIDCGARTIEALAHRRQDAAGAVTEYHEYAQDSEGPLPIEGGTVMEIAFLALCT